jgi:hypothetical protein
MFVKADDLRILKVSTKVINKQLTRELQDIRFAIS